MTLQEYKAYALAKKQIEYHSFDPRAKFQCIDLVNDYITKVWGLEAIIGTDAKDVPERLKPGMEFVENTPEYLPNPGEVAVWNGKVGGGAGHISVVTDKGSQLTFKSLDQNWSKPLYITEEIHSYNNVRGFIRKKGATMDYEQLYNEARTARDNHWKKLQQVAGLIGKEINDQTVDPIFTEAITTFKAWKSSAERLTAEIATKDKVISNQIGELSALTSKYNAEVTAHKATAKALTDCQANQPEGEPVKWAENGKNVSKRYDKQNVLQETIIDINYGRV